MALLRGRLLVATPLIGGGPFWRSVVFMLDHSDEGALGVIVNRPLNAAVADVLPHWADVVTAPTQPFRRRTGRQRCGAGGRRRP